MFFLCVVMLTRSSTECPTSVVATATLEPNLCLMLEDGWKTGLWLKDTLKEWLNAPPVVQLWLNEPPPLLQLWLKEPPPLLQLWLKEPPPLLQLWLKDILKEWLKEWFQEPPVAQLWWNEPPPPLLQLEPPPVVQLWWNEPPAPCAWPPIASPTGGSPFNACSHKRWRIEHIPESQMISDHHDQTT